MQQRVTSHAVRTLRREGSGVDLSSNDYLGMARKLAHPEVVARILDSGRKGIVGATGSRLVTGNTEAHEELESFLASFHGAEGALLFGSGYEANIGLLSTIASRADTIIYDELVHASMRDGIRLSSARAYSFRHNDLQDLEQKMRAARGECFIVVESVYSMDGDQAPLVELCQLVERAGAYLIVDEAHSTGVYGPGGAGCVVELGLCHGVLARIHTFGKALGYRGACVVGSHALREHLINSARSFIYTTAPDQVMLRYMREAYDMMRAADDERRQLKLLIAGMTAVRTMHPEVSFLKSESPIQGVLLPGNSRALRAESALHEAGFVARAIRAPTVPRGLERVRLCLHSYNSIQEVEQAVEVLAALLRETQSRVGGLDG
jgi:8-amino-7-oxononanoate synthase